MRDAGPADLEAWDASIIANPDGGQALQTRAWGEFKRGHAWVPRYLLHEEARTSLAILVLRRRVPGLGELWYVPKGPGVADPEQLRAVCTALRRMPHVFGVKVEPELIDGEAARSVLGDIGLRKSRHDVQISRATIIVKLRDDEDALLASFKSKTRYNIRLAARRGVTVEPVAPDETNLRTMYGLMGATRDRAGFLLRPYEYFRGYWRLQSAAGEGQLFFATWRRQVLAGLFATFLGSKGWYKDGGSVKGHAAVMAPHLLQWEVMRWLRARGVRTYDLVAVPPASQLVESHPLYGLYRFKSGFSEEITEFVGTWDLVIDRARFAMWEKLVERATDQWALRVRHDLMW